MSKKKEEVAEVQVVNLPTLLYRCPGSFQRHGGTYTYKSAETDQEYNQLIAAGYHPTLTEAVETYELDKKTANK